MKIITDYSQLNISRLQHTRLYMQGRPLVSLWAKTRRGQQEIIPNFVKLIDSELTTDYIAIDCGGWYFANAQRHCTTVELMSISSLYWKDVHYEYDYLTWHPNYLPALPVLAYYSTYFKYCELEDFLTFCNIWTEDHPKIIIGLDPTKIKFNYLKWNLLQIIADRLPKLEITILEQSDFNMLFTIKQK